MAINVGIQRISRAIARRVGNISTVDLESLSGGQGEVTLYIEGLGHEDAAARIATLINEQVVRRDTPPKPTPSYDETMGYGEELRRAQAQSDDGPGYDEADDEQQRYETEDQAGKEAHLRAVRRDDKPWTPHEDRIERDVREGRRDADGDPL